MDLARDCSKMVVRGHASEVGFVRYLLLVKLSAVQRIDFALQDPRNLNRYGLDITLAQKRSLAGLERTEKQLLMGALRCHL